MYFDLSKIDLNKYYNIKYHKCGYGRRYRKKQKSKIKFINGV